MQEDCEFYLGMDGGGTKTECVLLAKSPNGLLQEKNRFCVSGINYNSYSKEQIRTALFEIGERVEIRTLTGRIVSGVLKNASPTYEHGFGKTFIPEMIEIGISIRKLLEDEHE